MTSDISNLPPVFHEGEDSLHKLLGIEKRLSELGKHVIRDHMPDQHREFFQQLRWVHVAAIDGLGHPWALIRAGDAGFMHSPDDRTLQIRSEPLPGEPGDLQLAVGSKIGIVGLEPSSLRRNRLNATIRNESKNMLTLSVDQSYGNCPQYIRKRSVQPGTARSRAVVSVHKKLEQTDVEILERADTIFIASRARHLTNDPRCGVDINHRGGSPGFITILDDSTIIIPDYKGNNFFNTLGNILLEPRVGIQVIDYTTATLLNLQGSAKIFDVDTSGLLSPDTGRRIKISIESVICSAGAFPYNLSILKSQ